MAPVPDLAAPPPSFQRELTGLMPDLRRFAVSLHAGNHDRGADLAQDALERAWKYREQFTPGTNLKAWVFFICRNAFMTERRRAWRWQQPPVVRGKDGDEVEDFDRYLTTRHAGPDRLALAELLEAISYLPADQSECVLLAGEGLSIEEIALEIGVSEGTVKSRVSRGRDALEAYFGLNIENRRAA